MNFHEIRFPTAISLAAAGGPERRTDIVVLGSGFEERNSRWADSRRRYDAGYGIKTLDELHAVIAFFEERRGALYGFRWKDPADYKSSLPLSTPTAMDQVLGTGDGATAEYQLVKHYGVEFAPWTRTIAKPVIGTAALAVDGSMKSEGGDYTLDSTTGKVTFVASSIPPPGAIVTAGFEFDVPVRFEVDRLEINVMGFKHGAIPSIPLVEVRL
ncbi:MAG: DUF2460 domain-containing protein [Alphaproteobacteria bacterium]|nr:DUF2460 domain-containing protein [Alphaproteobacteria bacterium]